MHLNHPKATPHPLPQSMEKLSSTKVVLSAEKVGDNRSKEPERNLPLPLPRGQMAHMTWAQPVRLTVSGTGILTKC